MNIKTLHLHFCFSFFCIGFENTRCTLHHVDRGIPILLGICKLGIVLLLFSIIEEKIYFSCKLTILDIYGFVPKQ